MSDAADGGGKPRAPVSPLSPGPPTAMPVSAPPRPLLSTGPPQISKPPPSPRREHGDERPTPLLSPGGKMRKAVSGGLGGPLLPAAEPLADGPAEGDRGGLLLSWVHMPLGARVGFPLQWAIAPSVDDEAQPGAPTPAEVGGCKPCVTFRDPYGQPVQELLRRARAAGGARPDDIDVVEEASLEEAQGTPSGPGAMVPLPGREVIPPLDRSPRTVSVYIDPWEPPPAPEEKAPAGKVDRMERSMLAPPTLTPGAPMTAPSPGLAAGHRLGGNPDADIRRLCKQCLKDTLRCEMTRDIDGCEDLTQIRVGQKLSRNLSVAGLRAFGYAYSLFRKKDKMWEGFRYLIGAYEPRRKARVLVLIATPQEELYPTLQRYAQDVLAPFLGRTAHFQLFRPAPPPPPPEEEEAPSAALLLGLEGGGDAVRAERGCVRYYNAGAAISFELPAYAQEWRRGASLTRARSTAHVLCLTVLVRVHPAALPAFPGEPEADDELALSARQPVDVSVGVDVEDIVRARLPSIMSAAEYAALKMRPVMQDFLNSKPNGAPLTTTIGGRHGVSFLWTANVSSEPRVSNYQKAMCSATLNNNKGVVSSFFTKMGQGIFDTNLHIFQDLLRSVHFIPEREADGDFEFGGATSERLQSQEHFRGAFSAKEQGGPSLVARYRFLAGCSTGGKPPVACGTAVSLLAEDVGRETTAGADDQQGKKGRKAKGKGFFAQKGADADTDSVVDVSDIRHLNVSDEDAAYWASVEESAAAEAAASPAAGPADAAAAAATEAEDAARREAEEAAAKDAAEREAAEAAEAEAAAAAQAAEAAAAEEEAARAAGSKEEVEEKKKSAKEQVEEDALEGVSLRHKYARICARLGVRANSRFLAKLPAEMVLTAAIEELDLSLNYFGGGFAAAAELIRHMPRLHTLYCNDMSLSDADVKALCGAAGGHARLRRIVLRDNQKVTLASGRPLIALARGNKLIEEIDVAGTAVGHDVAARISSEIRAHAQWRAEQRQQVADP